MNLPSGVTSRKIHTHRLETHILEHGAKDGVPVLLIHGNVSSSRFFDELLAAMPSHFYAIALDLRGFGESESKPIDARRGLCDWADDIRALVEALGLGDKKVHLLGWSMGGGIAMQYAISHATQVASLTLSAPVSPYGFGGTHGIEGTLNVADGAGSGGGCANPEFVKLIAAGDSSADTPVSPRNVMNAFYFKPPFTVAPAVEDRFVASMNKTVVGEGNYPGNLTSSSNWPMVAPGTKGILNAIATTHMNLSTFAQINPKPPVLWIRGDSDQIISDTSFFDLAFLGSLGAVPGWPGAEACPAQPMVGQTRAVFEQYKANGGSYHEVVFENCGHTPHVEKAEDFRQEFLGFIGG